MMVAKANQPGLLQDIQTLFQRAEADVAASAELVNPFRPVAVRAVGEQVDWQLEEAASFSLAHGRIEKRTLCALGLPPQHKALWPAAQQVVRIERSVQYKKSGKKSLEVVYGITSLTRRQADATALLEINRAHWGIENRSHWIRDVLWDEDQCRVRTGNTAQALAAFRNLAMPLLRRIVPDNITHATRKCAANPMRALKLILRTE
jgi:predicted transposase YbfD/YdcC